MTDKKRAAALLEATATFMEEGVLDLDTAAKQIRTIIPLLLPGAAGSTSIPIPRPNAANKRNLEKVVFVEGQMTTAGHLVIRGTANFPLREKVRASFPSMKKRGMTDVAIALYFNIGADSRVSDIRSYKYDTEEERLRSPYFDKDEYRSVLGRAGGMMITPEPDPEHDEPQLPLYGGASDKEDDA